MKFEKFASSGVLSGAAAYGLKSHNRFRTPLDFVIRRGERTVFSFDATWLLNAADEQSVRVINFSEFGFLAACEHPPTPGAPVVLKLAEAGDVPARVVWTKGVLAGGRFEQQIDVNGLVDLLESKQVD
jgi:PilZ domain